jgi:beta-glucosidase-like glycosyl hydrolase
MNLEEQIGAIDAQVDRLSELVRLAQAAVERAQAERAEAQEAARAASTAAQNAAEANEAKPTLRVARPSHNEVTLSIGAQTVTLHPEQIGQLIEELANARASMTPEPPMELPAGWRFAATKNPVIGMQKQANGDRLLIARHTGHGWVPFTFSPDAAVQLYMMLTQR